jgi:hypothetical protein
MKAYEFITLASYAIEMEVERFQTRIAEIFKEISKEGQYDFNCDSLADIFWNVKARYTLYYPKDAFFDLILKDEFEKYKLNALSNKTKVRKDKDNE